MATIHLAHVPGGRINMCLQAPFRLTPLSKLKDVTEMLRAFRLESSNAGCEPDADRRVTTVTVDLPGDLNDMGVELVVSQFTQILQRGFGICDIRVNNMLNIPVVVH